LDEAPVPPSRLAENTVPARHDRRNDHLFAEPRGIARHDGPTDLVSQRERRLAHGGDAVEEIAEVCVAHAAAGYLNEHLPLLEGGYRYLRHLQLPLGHFPCLTVL